MRRSLIAVTTALLTTGALAATVPVASAGDPLVPTCPTNDGEAVVQAQPGARNMWVTSADDGVTVLTERGWVCRVDPGSATSIRLGDSDGAVEAWALYLETALPGPVRVANGDTDLVRVDLVPGADDSVRTTRTSGVLLLDDVARTRQRVEVQVVPRVLVLRGQGGADVVDLTRGAGWDRDVSLDLASGQSNGPEAGDSLEARLGEGDDSVYGGQAADSVDAGGGDDEVHTYDGADTVVGGAGADLLDGMKGRDELLGGGGLDDLTGGPGADDLSGGAGRDVLRGADGVRDVLDGGAGRDTASWDRVDTRSSIESRLR